jgi:hypothetical protein
MNELADPRTQLGPPEVDYMATLKDADALVRLFQEAGYTAEAKIKKLCLIFNDGTAAQSMMAMDRLEAIYEAALARRSVLPGAGVNMPRFADGQPALGLPAAQGVRVTVRQTRTANFTVGSALKQFDELAERMDQDGKAGTQAQDATFTPPAPQPSEPPTGPDGSTPDQPDPAVRLGEGDDDYYPDSDGDDLFRPPTESLIEQSPVSGQV